MTNKSFYYRYVSGNQNVEPTDALRLSERFRFIDSDEPFTFRYKHYDTQAAVTLDFSVIIRGERKRTSHRNPYNPKIKINAGHGEHEDVSRDVAGAIDPDLGYLLKVNSQGEACL